MKILRLALPLLVALHLPTPACAITPAASSDKASASVSIAASGSAVTLENGLVSVKIDKATGNLLAIRYHGEDLIDGSGYWNILGNVPGAENTEQKGAITALRITQDPAHNGGDIGEVEFVFPYNKQANSEPLDISIRYTLRRGDSGIYAWTSATHHPGYPPFDIELSSFTLKLQSSVFDHLTIDSRRNLQMISGSDWTHGTPLNMKEARRMTTGIHKGEPEHKYDYSAMFSATPAYGWSSTAKHVGIWIVNPSLEYINGAPTHQELTGHIDVKDTLPADPTLLFVWHGSHYGGEPIAIAADDAWTKVVGPFLIYCNSGPTPDAMGHDALERAASEQKQWPYPWAKAPGYASAAERGSVSGKLAVHDPQQPSASAAHAWVGLAAAPYTGVDHKRRPLPITWEIDGKNYEYWARADDSGAFSIPNARPGNYVLYAFNDGILGDFSHANVTVQAGKTTDLGSLTWTPVRFGRQLWQIGIPNRSAEEFRHGDHYWQWGLYNLYPQEFPTDVNFIIGKSDYKKDWNYAQPPRLVSPGKWTGTTWRITFNTASLPPGKATLRLAICGSRGNSVAVSVNGTSIGNTSPLPDSGVMHRDGIRSVEAERNLSFDTSLLVNGENHIDLTPHAPDWTDGILYDYLRLEVEDAAPPKPSASDAAPRN